MAWIKGTDTHGSTVYFDLNKLSIVRCRYDNVIQIGDTSGLIEIADNLEECVANELAVELIMYSQDLEDTNIYVIEDLVAELRVELE